jgi:hypothetical protein
MDHSKSLKQLMIILIKWIYQVSMMLLFTFNVCDLSLFDVDDEL